MRLIWHQRKDGLWNAACSCHATLCGVEFERRAHVEEWHFDHAATERKRRAEQPSMGSQLPVCGPKLPDPNPNIPGPLVFP